jgi:electron transfer flavoprotein alpha subunit
MTDYIVLLKQVPDVSQITDNAFDPETGNLIRTRLPSVINELDSEALAFANLMRRQKGGEGRIICLTMGPPMAKDVLVYGLSRAADDAVLLTDRALGGADTWATANPLAGAIRRIAAEKLGGSEDYFIVSGMQSVDGDTAQVPGQVAEELGVPVVAYATGVEYNEGRFEFKRIISGGSEVVATKRVPAVVTVAKYEYTLYESFSGARRARELEVSQWSANDVEAKYTGVKGSKTRVIRVFPPGKTTRECRKVNDGGELAELLGECLTDRGAGEDKADSGKDVNVGERDYVSPSERVSLLDRSFEGTERDREDYTKLGSELRYLNITQARKIDEEVISKILASETVNFHEKALRDMVEGYKCERLSYDGDVWVVAEHEDGRCSEATFELLGKARRLGESLGKRVGVCIAGDDVAGMSDELIACGADDVYVIEHPLLERFDPWSYRKVISEAIQSYSPQICLFAATAQGRVLAPMVSYRCGCGLTADCTGLAIRDISRKGVIGALFQTRPALGGNIMATIITKDSSCQMATARPGVMKRLSPDANRRGEVIKVEADLSEADLSVDLISATKGSGGVDFSADVIVSGGKGMHDRDTFERLTGSLCNSISERFGVNVIRGATRAAVEQGFIERAHQVGQTGTAVGPRLYVALGISGAIQHMIGVASSEKIIAINSDPEAPIFRQCDYYIVGSVEKIVPEIVDQLKAVKV